MKEELHVSAKNADMKHIKSLGMLVGTCVLFSLKEWYQKETSMSIEEDEKSRIKNRKCISVRAFRKSNGSMCNNG